MPADTDCVAEVTCGVFAQRVRTVARSVGRWRTPSPWLPMLLALTLLPGCESARYLGQAARGQMELLRIARPIDQVLTRPDLDPRVGRRLRLIMAARTFAREQLRLDPGGSYERYAETGRDALVWNVFAAPRYAVDPLTWCFPIAGCVAYRGYFSRGGAERQAGELRARGFDVYIGEVDAYSTLGWFDDPVVDTWLTRSDPALLGLVFHELAHGRVYLPGDTEFNESYATVVQLEGTRRWYARHGDSAAFERYRRGLLEWRAFVDFMARWREELRRRYAAAALVRQPEVRDRAFAELQAEYLELRSGLGGGRFDSIVLEDLSNARLVPLAAYWGQVEAFEALLDASRDMDEFHAAVEELADLDATTRAERLAALRDQAISR